MRRREAHVAQGAECSQGELCGDCHGHSNHGQSSKEGPVEQWGQHLEPRPTRMPENATHQGKKSRAVPALIGP